MSSRCLLDIGTILTVAKVKPWKSFSMIVRLTVHFWEILWEKAPYLNVVTNMRVKSETRLSYILR